MGNFQAKPVKDIILGRDYFVWNYGSTSKPLKIIKKTPTQIIFKTVDDNGRFWKRRLNKNRLVAFTTKEDY